MALAGERRRRRRVSLHLLVQLRRQQGTSLIEGITENISSEGLYCISQEKFELDARLQCKIMIPEGSFGLESSRVLDCRVTVRRVEELPTGFGLGCQIEDYTLAIDPELVPIGP